MSFLTGFVDSTPRLHDRRNQRRPRYVADQDDVLAPGRGILLAITCGTLLWVVIILIAM